MSSSDTSRTDDSLPRTDFNPAVVTPTYNNAGTLRGILDRLETLGLPLIVVNDGSTDATGGLLSDWSAAARTVRVTILTHPRNRGKAAAMRSGFATAISAGHTHVVTIDTDGQLDPEDIPSMLSVASDQPDAIVLGSRRRDIAGCPRANRLAWYLAALGIFLETGRRILDSQCGLRVYPLRLLSFVRCGSRRYGFESEVLTRSLWAGAPVAEVPVACRYFPMSQRVSHFKPLRDGLHSFFMHFALTVRQVFPWPHRRLDPLRPWDRDSSSESAFVAQCWKSVNPLEIGRSLRRDHFEQLLIAAALGIGAFVSNMPLGAWQIGLAVYVALRTHVHILPTVSGSGLCLTPVAPFLNELAIRIGYFLLHFSSPGMEMSASSGLSHWQRLTHFPVSWPLGAVIVGFVCTWIVLPFFERLFRLIPVRHSKRDS